MARKPLKAMIVDDEELARRGLELRLQSMDGVEVCGQCRNGREALAALEECKPDVLFLDIKMPGMDGFDVLRALGGSDAPVVIFVTAFAEHAVRAFEANALDYLLKPIDESRLEAALARAVEQLDARAASVHRAKLLKLICDLTGEEISLDDVLDRVTGESQPYPRELAIKDGRETTRVAVGDIEWIDSAGDYVCIHASGDTHILRGTMKSLERILDPGRFIRIHRSTIVNRQHVSSMRSHINGEYFVKLDCGKEVKLSRTYSDCAERLMPPTV